MDERLRFVARLLEGEQMAVLCREFGISRVRSCGILRVDGRDVGDILISEGLAVPFVCGATSCPPTPKPWCG